MESQKPDSNLRHFSGDDHIMHVEILEEGSPLAPRVRAVEVGFKNRSKLNLG